MMLPALLALLLCGPARAQDFAAAQKAYDAGDYEASAGELRKLVDASPRDAFLRYDLGNALLKSGRLGRAVAQYQRAFDLRPRSSDIRYNLEFALKSAGEEFVPPGVPPFVYAAFHLLSLNELAGLHWLGCWLALLLASAWLRLRERREALKTPLLGAAAFWGFFGIWALGRWTLEPSNVGVIVKAAAELRSGPGENFPVGFTAPEGRRVQILSEAGQWLEVGTLKEGAKGWALADDVVRIKEK
jgi:tetratricopeptide (TPR) repeat protein